MENNILNHPSSLEKIVFGPVPSRRLGSSLGVNILNVRYALTTASIVSAVKQLVALWIEIIVCLLTNYTIL